MEFDFASVAVALFNTKKSSCTPNPRSPLFLFKKNIFSTSDALLSYTKYYRKYHQKILYTLQDHPLYIHMQVPQFSILHDKIQPCVGSQVLGTSLCIYLPTYSQASVFCYSVGSDTLALEIQYSGRYLELGLQVSRCRQQCSMQ